MRFLERFWFGCGHCHEGRGCPVLDHVDPESGQVRGLPEGPRLVAVLIAVFILPLATALGGAGIAEVWCGGATGLAAAAWQLGGALAGFGVGVALAKLILWLGRRYLAADGGVR